MKKQTLFAVLIAVAALVAIPVTASAQQAEQAPGNTGNGRGEAARTLAKERISDRAEEARAAREARVLERCGALQDKLTARADRVKASADRHAEIYAKLESRLQKVIDYATEEAYDTTALLSAQASIGEKIDAFTVAADEYATALTDTESVSCETDATPYGEAIVNARDALRNLREAAKAVHEAFRTEAVPAFTDFAKSLEDAEPSDETETEPAQENQ